MIAAQIPAVDETKIKKAILSGLPLTITTYTLPREIEVYIEEVLTVFLEYAGQEKLRSYIFYCVQELAVNAKKANTKRVYFDELGLDISRQEDYQAGMAHFRETTTADIDRYLKLQKEKGLYIRLILQVRENTMNIEVRNNVIVTRNEMIRIHDRVARSRQYGSLEEAFSQVIDDSEGAGLGLIILVLMLKKIGLDEDCFDIHNNETETIAQIKIPLNQIHVENISILSMAIVNAVNSLPPFPENILAIQQLTANPNADLGIIARRISTDPALTADVLRIVNSAQYMQMKRVDNISEAVKMIGLRGIRNLLFSYGTRQVLGDDSEEQKKLWEHSYRTAFYARTLAKNRKHDNALCEDAYSSGILHDMGKIIFSGAHPQLLGSIAAFCAERNIPIATLEYLSAGMNHAEIGALIAEKWNFPDSLITVIRYHHNPAAAPAEYRILVNVIYLANMLCLYENGDIQMNQFAEEYLIPFGIISQEKLNTLLGNLCEEYKKRTAQD